MASTNSRLFELISGARSLRDKAYRKFSFYELKITYMISHRYSNDEIAAKLFISEKSVRNIRAKIYKKFKLDGSANQRRKKLIEETTAVMDLLRSSYFNFDFEDWMLEHLMTEPITLMWNKQAINRSVNHAFFKIAAVEPLSNDLGIIAAGLECYKSNVCYWKKQIIDELIRIDPDVNRSQWSHIAREICMSFIEEFKYGDE